MTTATRQGRRTLAGVALLLVLGVIATTGSTTRRASHAPAPAARSAAAAVLTTRAVHDVSGSLRGIAPMPAATAVPSAAERAEAVMEANEAQARAATGPGVPDLGAAEQTAPGPRAPITPAITFDNGLDGGSTSDNNIGAGPDSIVVMRNSRFKVMSKTGETLLGPLNNNSIPTAIACSRASTPPSSA